MTLCKLTAAAVIGFGVAGPASAQVYVENAVPQAPMVTAGGTVFQGGYAVPMATTYQQSQIVQSSYATPVTYFQPSVVTYSTPAVYGSTYSYSDYTTSSVSNYSNYGYTSYGTGYATPSYTSPGIVGTVVAVPSRVVRRLLRR